MPNPNLPETEKVRIQREMDRILREQSERDVLRPANDTFVADLEYRTLPGRTGDDMARAVMA